MAQVLSQEEIDALLTNVDTEESLAAPAEAPSDPGHTEGERKAVLYDFKHPNRVSKDQLRSLESLHDNFANQFGSQLSGFTRSVVDVDLLSVDQITYSEFIMSLATPSCTYVFILDPIDGAGIMDFSPSIAFSFVDRMFGGKGKALSTERELTGIEKSIMSKIIARAFHALGKAWEHVEKLEFRQSGFESNPQFIQIVPPGETVVVVSLQIKMLSSSALVTLCYPYLTLEPIMEKLSTQHWIEARKKGDDSGRYDSNAKNLSAVSTDLKAFLGGTTVTVKDLMNLKPGDVVRLDENENDYAIVYVGDRKKFLAVPGRSGKMKAVKIKDKI
ncbi:MAG: flagellar motor switch protein FliM [Candidatus Zixiibacteriota bacterium]|nr:MAG: flagellar motor switch protein FliM [candidate division Zixibacteria bacterium]